MSDETEIVDCPFCGSNAVDPGEPETFTETREYVCRSCGAIGPSVPFRETPEATLAAAREAWNHRAPVVLPAGVRDAPLSAIYDNDENDPRTHGERVLAVLKRHGIKVAE